MAREQAKVLKRMVFVLRRKQEWVMRKCLLSMDGRRLVRAKENLFDSDMSVLSEIPHNEQSVCSA
jgi:hypothetical protein